MWDFNLSGAFDAMRRTAPFVIARMLVYFGISILYILSTGVGGALGYGVTAFGKGAGGGAFFGALIGFAGASGLLYWLRETILYLVKAGHVAVLVRLYEGQVLPDGRSQIEYAIGIVKERFTESTVLFALDQLIKGVLRMIGGVVEGVSTLLPVPGLDSLVKVLNGIVRMSLSYVDEIILAKIIRDASTNPWETGRQALVLYAQNYKLMIKNAVWLWLFTALLTLLIFLLMLGPSFAIMALIPGKLGFWAFVTAFVLAWSVKMALIEPLAIYAYMQIYFKAIEGQTLRYPHEFLLRL
ncbi:hypothetical protein [uncultured Thiodictyon sp.]|uniref:hypothetical protein n=1 Tax=uncultured Thiodictyon sp. TaxID=1846217 RepID=UPI0025E4F273|nr:hypothetical protein [uncultured Thiodictyon sp.]